MSQVKVHNKSVCCNGDEDGSGHPMIYLDMGEEEEKISCPYCNTVFIYDCTVEPFIKQEPLKHSKENS